MKFLIQIWRFINIVLAAFFLYLIAEAWVQIFYFRSAEKQYYYLATLFFIPFFTCLAVSFGWFSDTENGDYKK